MNGPNADSLSNSARTPPSSPSTSEKRSTAPGTPVFASSCSPIQRDVRYLSFESSFAPMALMRITDCTPAAFAASPTMRGPSALTSNIDCGLLRRTATRSITCSTPFIASATDAGFIASPTTTSAPRTL